MDRKCVPFATRAPQQTQVLDLGPTPAQEEEAVRFTAALEREVRAGRAWVMGTGKPEDTRYVLTPEAAEHLGITVTCGRDHGPRT